MNLSKIELQEMLREMGLKFSPTASYEELRQMFQDENHRRWLGQHRPDGPKRVIRRRRTPPKVAPEAAPPEPVSPEKIEAGAAQNDPSARPAARPKPRPRRELLSRRLMRTNGEAVVFDRQKNVFATVLRRSKRCCELCDLTAPKDPAQSQDFLKPYYLVPLSEGGQEVIKNVVALCPDCHYKVTTQPNQADFKILKRKARQKVISSVVVVRR
jgi:hypothetical protein